MSDPVLLPAPRRLVLQGPGRALAGPVRIGLAAGAPPEAALARVTRALERLGLAWERAADPRDADVAFALDHDVEGVKGVEGVEGAEPGEAYRLVIDPSGVRARAADARGLAHAASTLAQLLAQAPGRRLPGLVIDDAPSFARRGAMLDVSRDRVPTMETLRALIERFASWKLNEVELYLEHAFAYPGHAEVWRDASPITPAEMRALDAYARERGVALVPNQNCFGHMHRWLRLPRYRPLAEVPAGVRHPFALEPEPFSLCPSDPGTPRLIAELLGELCACCAADEVNVGLDETFDLGLGRSRAACAERGVGRVYLDHLLAVRAIAARLGRRVRAWADVLLAHPELVPEVPRDVVAMLWGYDAGHPFDAQAALCAQSGLALHVCPGTSSWQSFTGRTGNMLANVAAAARAGVAVGARGLTVTDWGDRGHLQPLPVSYAGWARAADLAWNAGADGAEARLARALDLFAFECAAGAAALELGRVEEAMATGATNGAAAFFLIAMADEPVPSSRVPRLSRDAVERGLATLDRGRARLPDGVGPGASDRGLAVRELAHAADLAELGLRLGAARLEAGGATPIAALPRSVRAELAGRLEAVLRDHATLWDARSRPGGRAASAGWLARLRGPLAGETPE